MSNGSIRIFRAMVVGLRLLFALSMSVRAQEITEDASINIPLLIRPSIFFRRLFWPLRHRLTGSAPRYA